MGRFQSIKKHLISLILAGLVSWFFYYLGKEEVIPVYATEKPQVFAEMTDDVPELVLLWDGAPIENFHTTRVAIWNSGSGYIDARLLKPSDPIVIEIPENVKLLSASISDKSRADLDVKVLESVSHDRPVILISLENDEALETSDGFAVKLYYTASGAYSFSVRGRVKGTMGFEERDWSQEFSKPTHWSVVIFLLGCLIVLCSLLFQINTYLKEGNKPKAIDKSLSAALYGIMVIGLIYYIFVPSIFGMQWLSG